MNFAKLFEIDGEQVLFYLEPDKDADGCEKINQIVRMGGTYINMAACAIPYEKADEAFAKIDEAFARNALETARGMFNRFVPDEE